MSTTAATTNRRATVVGLGLIGGSICVALRERGWLVSGDDQDAQRVTEALERGLISAAGIDAESQVTFVAVPVTAISLQVQRALDATSGIVTDVGSVNAVVTRTITDPRFIGGHPMAGSELEGLDGADGELFTGAVWVLTPTPTTSDAAFATVANIVNDLGAEVVGLDPVRHDELVAIVSHVPHLTAATLMGVAGSRATEHAALLRLAAGGFRDFTRIASSDPVMWRDIFVTNADATVRILDEYINDLQRLREVVIKRDADELHKIFKRANASRDVFLAYSSAAQTGQIPRRAK